MTPRMRAIVVGMAFLLVAAPAGASDVRVEGTTDTTDSGLIQDVIQPGFEAAFPQYTLKYHATGTGAALTDARAGQADAVLTHAPSSEAQFVQDGFSLEPFGRAQNATAKHIPGLGLGLYICRDLIARHGGRIWAESPGEGMGTTFVVVLPVGA